MFGRGGGGVLGPAVAGTWYPMDGAALERQVDGFFRQAEAEAEASDAATTAPRTTALIAPHAGFAYSGLVAAKGFRLLGEEPVERVLLLGPSHYAAFQGAVLADATTYRTPLGDVTIDTGAIATLATRSGFRVDSRPFAREHCLEAEIPFLQRRLAPGWRLVPVLVGGVGSDGAAGLAEGLRALLGPQTLVVVSSDFTHYGPRFGYVPFSDDLPRRIERLDMGAIERILARDVEGFESYVDRTGATICGRHPIRVLLRLMSSDVEATLAAYDTSGRVTGEWDHSVSYASVAFHGAPP